MDEHVAELQGRISRGEYQVQPVEVAEAIVSWLRQLKECSYPDSRRAASVNVTPGSPSVT
jgi:hypothetical protein